MQIGQKVVCINEPPDWVRRPSHPIKGETYVILEIDGQGFLSFTEFNIDFPTGTEMLFWRGTHFRPLDDFKIEMPELKELELCETL